MIRGTSRRRGTPNLPTSIVDFRGFDSSIVLICSKGWNSHVHRGFPGKLGSGNVSRDTFSREIGRLSGMLLVIHFFVFSNTLLHF